MRNIGLWPHGAVVAPHGHLPKLIWRKQASYTSGIAPVVVVVVVPVAVAVVVVVVVVVVVPLYIWFATDPDSLQAF